MTEHRPGHPVALLLAALTTAVAACGSGVGDDTSTAEGPAPAGATSSTAASTGSVDPTLERPGDLDMVREFVFEGMATYLQEAADRLGRGEDPTFSCAGVLAIAEGEETAGLEAAATKAREQCGREIPIEWAARQLDAVEAEGDIARSIGECASVAVALDTVQDRFTDPRVDELRDRENQLCR
jgi:hypothetical protein